VQVLEIFPTGESGYKSTMTLNQLLAFIHAGVVKIDADAKARVSEAPEGDTLETGSKDERADDDDGASNLAPRSPASR
jgi:hypothetical protein